MAKKATSAKKTASVSTPDGRKADRLGDFAEELGRLLGRTERKALAERAHLAPQHTAIRDRAQGLLEQLGSMAPALRRPRKAKPTKPVPGAAVPPSVKKRARKGANADPSRVATSDAVVKQAEAQRRRWADYRRGDG
jgi:hypothetical protein